MWSPKNHFYFILSLNSSHSIQYSLIVLPDQVVITQYYAKVKYTCQVIKYVMTKCQRTLVYCFCTKFGQLILRKIIKTVATRYQILRLKCIKIKNSAGAPPQTPLRSLQPSPDPLAGFKGPTSKRRGGSVGEGTRGEQTGRECNVSINDSVSVDLGIAHSGAIANSELVVGVPNRYV